MFNEQREDVSHRTAFLLIDDQTTTGRIDIIAEHGCASDPLTLAPRCRHLVARSLTYDFPFKLCKGEQNVQREAAERRRRIELLGHRDEADWPLIEPVYQPSKIEQGTAEPVNLVDHNAIYLVAFDVFEQPLQRGTIEVPAGEL